MHVCLSDVAIPNVYKALCFHGLVCGKNSRVETLSLNIFPTPKIVSNASFSPRWTWRAHVSLSGFAILVSLKVYQALVDVSVALNLKQIIECMEV